MRVLLDESVPQPLAAQLPGHEVRTVPQMGWVGTDNDELLRRAVAAGAHWAFEAMITVDRSIEYQQNIARSGLGVVVLIAPSNRRRYILSLAPNILAALAVLQPGQVAHVGGRPAP